MSPESTRRGFSISRPAGRRSTSRMRPPVSVRLDLQHHHQAVVLLELAGAAGGALEVDLLAVERVVGALDGEALGDAGSGVSAAPITETTASTGAIARRWRSVMRAGLQLRRP